MTVMIVGIAVEIALTQAPDSISTRLRLIAVKPEG